MTWHTVAPKEGDLACVGDTMQCTLHIKTVTGFLSGSFSGLGTAFMLLNRSLWHPYVVLNVLRQRTPQECVQDCNVKNVSAFSFCLSKAEIRVYGHM